MVRKVHKKGEILYACEVCELTYEERSWAEKCQDHCTEHNACSLEITSHSLDRSKDV